MKVSNVIERIKLLILGVKELRQQDKRKFHYLTAIAGFLTILIISLGVYDYSLNKANASGHGVIKASGTVECKEVSLNSKIPGKIVKLYFQEGDTVKAGDIIVEISSDELRAKEAQLQAQVNAARDAVNAAKGQTNAAKANLKKADNGARKQDIEKARLAYELAQKAQARVDQLYNNKKMETAALIESAKAAYQAAQAQTAAAKAIYDKAENGARSQEIAQVQAQYDLAKETFSRVEKLCEKGAISQQKREEVKTQVVLAAQALSMVKEGARSEDKSAAYQTYLTAKAGEDARKAQYDQAVAGMGEVDSTFGLKGDETEAQVEISKQTLDMAVEGTRTEDKSGAQALVAQAEAMEQAANAKLDQAVAGLDEVEAYLKDTLIMAPISGTITALNSNEGELVSTGMSIATISSVDKPWVSVNVKETDLGKVQLGQKVSVTVPGYNNKEFSGKVVSINKKPDFATQRATNDNGDFDILSFGVKIEVIKDGEMLKPGMTAFTTFF